MTPNDTHPDVGRHCEAFVHRSGAFEIREVGIAGAWIRTSAPATVEE